MHSDERLDYYLMVARLMSEADAQLRADATEKHSVGYSTELSELRRCIRGAEEAAARIAVRLMSSRIGRAEDQSGASAPRH